MFKGKGVHHVGVGVNNLETIVDFYQNTIGFTDVFVEFPESSHDSMFEVFRKPNIVFSGTMICQKAGGLIVELIRMVDPPSRPIRKDFKYGDIGVAKIAIAVSDVKQIYHELKGNVNFCSEPKVTSITGWGDYQFVYCKDPEGNLVEFVSSPKIPVNDKFGGARWIGASVTDLERSKQFYQKYLGFDTVVIDTHENISGLVNEISGGVDTEVRSCILANSNGGEMLELFETLRPRGRSIPHSTIWGDFGYMEICLECDDIHGMSKYYEDEDMEFLCHPNMVPPDEADFDGYDAWFMYIKDPDGIPIEFASLVPKTAN